MEWFCRVELAEIAGVVGRAPTSQEKEVRFAPDSPLEGSGFELSVPLRRATTPNRILSLR
jgi:hypothetical protein